MNIFKRYLKGFNKKDLNKTDMSGGVEDDFHVTFSEINSVEDDFHFTFSDINSVEENWERLVRACLLLRRDTNIIKSILEAADEIQDQDPNVSRILCEHAYSLALNLDPNCEGRGVLQFKTGMASVVKLKIAKTREGGRIDRSQDITHLQEFYKDYKHYELMLRESSTFGVFRHGLDQESMKWERVSATLNVLREVLEELTKNIPPEDAARLIPEEGLNNNNDRSEGVEENWERLVRACLLRRDTNSDTDIIESILEAADEIQDQDPTVSRILCEHAGSLARNLDPNCEGQGVLQFRTGMTSILKLKIAKTREGGCIDRSQDITRLQEFYNHYELTLLDQEPMKWERAFATLNVLREVLEELSNNIPPEDAARLIPEEGSNNNNDRSGGVEENWERLVRAILRKERDSAILRKERDRSGGRLHAASTGIASTVPTFLENNGGIDAILRVADEIQDQDPNISRILCEHAYTLAQNLDPNNEGRGVLQFKTSLMSVIKKLAKWERGSIDQNQDITRLREFYKHYRAKNKVDELREDEIKLREAGASGELDQESMKWERVSATLKVLREVLEELTKNIPPEDAARLIPEEGLNNNNDGSGGVEENWERLVRACLVPTFLENKNRAIIDAILIAADEIQNQDPSVPRILCDRAYSLALNLDPNSEGRGVLQFRTGLMAVAKETFERRERGSIDRNQDITRLQEFYKHYKAKNMVDELREDEIKLRESGASGKLEQKTMKRERVFATLKVLGEVLEELTKELPPEGVERLIPEEVSRGSDEPQEKSPEKITNNPSSMGMFLGELERKKMQHYSSGELSRITENFTNQIGSGAYGDVFKGKFSDGVPVAVKKLRDNSVNVMEYTFMAEVRTMSSTLHRHLVRLFGYCFEVNMKALVYEYLENGSLDKVLYENHLNLQWENLYEIAIGTAKGLSYLHEGCDEEIIHYDVKPGNVLLNSKLSPKVADFGMAKISGRDLSHISLIEFRGTRTYAAPEMWMQMPVTPKSDTYSLGMMLFEVLGRRRNVDGQNWIPGLVWEKFKKGQLDEVMEYCAIKDSDRLKAKILCTTALWCTQYRPEDRPTMSDVVQLLNGNKQLGSPPDPYYPYSVSTGRSKRGGSSTNISGPSHSRVE